MTDVARWYIIHVLSGAEKKVAQSIAEQAEQKGLSHLIPQVVVPTQEVIEVRRGQKVAAERKFFPGYVLVQMALNDEAWHLIRDIPKVSGFLGATGKPQAVPQAQVDKILRQIEDGAVAPKNLVSYEIGDMVKVIDGPFESFVGTVEDIDEGKQRLKVSVSIFGRATPVDLEFSQVIKTS
jgi:transcriptional antiterminator NusG